MIHALVIKTSLFMYFHESITLRKEILFLHPTSYNQPITAMCLAVNHPSCSNSFCVLSQSAFRPHTHFSIAYKVKCTSLHFIPPSLSLHSSISPFVYFSTWRDLLLSPLGCWFSFKSCDFCIPNFVYLKLVFNSHLELREC